MRGHGDVTVGPTVKMAVFRAYYTDVDARLQAQAVALGGEVNYLTPGEGAKADAINAAVIDRIWNLWKMRVASGAAENSALGRRRRIGLRSDRFRQNATDDSQFPSDCCCSVYSASHALRIDDAAVAKSRFLPPDAFVFAAQEHPPPVLVFPVINKGNNHETHDNRVGRSACAFEHISRWHKAAAAVVCPVEVPRVWAVLRRAVPPVHP